MKESGFRDPGSAVREKRARNPAPGDRCRKERTLAFLLVALACLIGTAVAQSPEYPAVEAGYTLQFPRDHGAHPAFRTEWWYLTGWVRDAQGVERGVQLTFFRNRPGVQEHNESRFAPKQLMFAHAAIADAAQASLIYDQRVARAGFGLAFANAGDTDVRIDDWTLIREGRDYRADIVSREFALALRFSPTQPTLLQGQAGLSRKGPAASQASYYYSRPHLAVSGDITIGEKRMAVRGEAWLDHEWSSEYLAPQASGWDWTGIHFSDGGALMAFRIRARDGSVFWAGGSYRDARGRLTVFSPHDIAFVPLRHWRSPRTGVEYPVAMRVRAGDMTLELEPMMDDQELDSRATTGTVYWEGAVRVRRDGKPVGKAYLELTGYFDRPDL